MVEEVEGVEVAKGVEEVEVVEGVEEFKVFCLGFWDEGTIKIQ